MEPLISEGRSSRRDAAWAVGLPIVLLLPFLGKAFHIDDPIYLRVAQHLLNSPWNFYGFNVNWYGMAQPVYDVNQNPPLLSYYLVPFGAVFGWSEWVMHGAMLLPAAAVIYGIYVIAARLGAPARWAAWFAVLNPLFFVSATTVMTDIPMLACWLWAVIAWMRGLEDGRARWFVAGGLLIGASFLFKYFGLSLLPLLALYTLMKQPRRPWPLLFLLLPVGIVAAYELWCYWLYGQGQFLAAFAFAGAYTESAGKDYFQKAVTTLAFLGGASLVVMAYPAFRFRWRFWLAVAGLGSWVVAGVIAPHSFFGDTSSTAVHLCLVVLGLLLLGNGFFEVTRGRRAEDALLFFWAAGTVVFVVFINHFVNARVLIPALPAIGILVTRGLRDVSRVHLYKALGLSVVLTLFVAHADLRLAGSARAAARAITERLHAIAPESRIWFAGHWGFQWYMEEAGGRPLDGQRPDLRPGDIVVSPRNNTNIVTINDALVGFQESLSYPVAPYVTTMSRELGAGFYSDVWGNDPFVFGRVPRETYDVLFLGGGWEFPQP